MISGLNGPHGDPDALNDISDTKTEIYLEDLQHLVEDARQMVSDPSKVKLVIEMNLKLREDLTKAFESYIQLLTKCDRLQRDKI